MALQNQEIGARLRELRGQKPQTVVADELGVAERTYQNWEGGDAKPSYRNLQRLADYFGVGEDFILAGEQEVVIRQAPPAPELFAEMEQQSVVAQLAALGERMARLEAIVEKAFVGRTAQGQDIIERLTNLEDAISGRVDASGERFLAEVLGVLEAYPPDARSARSKRPAPKKSGSRQG